MLKNLVGLFLSLCSILLSACGASGPSGTYTLDKAELAKSADAMAAKMGEKDNPMAGMAKMMADSLKGMEATITFDQGGTFSGQFKSEMMGQKHEESIKGTWKLEGDQLTMTSTEVGGKPKSETKTGTFKDGKIRIAEENNGQKMEMVFVKS